MLSSGDVYTQNTNLRGIPDECTAPWTWEKYMFSPRCLQTLSKIYISPLCYILCLFTIVLCFLLPAPLILWGGGHTSY